MLKRHIRLKFNDGKSDKDLELHKVSEINLTNGKEFIYLEKKSDGRWVLNYTKETIPEIKDLHSLEIIREN